MAGLRYMLVALRAAARERRALALENIALRHQVEVLTRNRRRPQLRPRTGCCGHGYPKLGLIGDATS